jgi:group I intron endonuclease
VKAFGVIYLITNLVTGKHYVGQTRRPLRVRWNGHLASGSGCRHLCAAIKKYGRDAFLIEAVFECENADELNKLETRCILALMSHHRVNGYNLGTGGKTPTRSEESIRRAADARRGTKLTAEHRRKISEGLKGQVFSAERCRNISDGKRDSPRKRETYRKIAAAQTGRPKSAETRLKMAASRKTSLLAQEALRKVHEARIGTKHSVEHRRKISESLKASPLTTEHLRRVHEAQKGKLRPFEVGRKISESKKANSAAISASMKAIWQRRRLPPV